MTVRDVSAYLRVHPSTIYKLLKRRQIPAFHVGSDWRFDIEMIDSWRLAQGKTGSSAVDPLWESGKHRLPCRADPGLAGRGDGLKSHSRVQTLPTLAERRQKARALCVLIDISPFGFLVASARCQA